MTKEKNEKIESVEDLLKLIQKIVLPTGYYVEEVRILQEFYSPTELHLIIKKQPN
nr:MAG: hypothetical protein [uncultured archaeon]